MRKSSSLVVIVMLAAAVAGAVAIQGGGGRLREWLLALHGMHAGHGSARPRQARQGAAAVWPQTRVGLLAHQWVEAFSSGEDAMRAFLTRELAPASLEQRGVDERLESYRASHQRFGSLTLASVGASSAGMLELTLNAADGSPHDFTFEGQTDAPFKLLSVKQTEVYTR
jgi:hypothetical protein